MARSKKEPRKWTPEERAVDVWNQQLFFLRKNFPQAEDTIQKICRRYTPNARSAVFIPTEEATNALRELYFELKSTHPAPTASI
jgi:hypothetical protein